jgi:MOSC domain-containing protein
MSSIVVSELNLYPLKSAAGFSVDRMVLQTRGPEHDRRWMLINKQGEFITQRQYSRMCLIHTSVENNAQLTLSANGMQPLVITPAEVAKTLTVQVWEDRVQANDCGDEAANWVSEFLGERCRMVFMPETTQRPVDPNYARNNEIVSFSDGFPLLLISQESLDEFNTHLSSSITMKRFRPNIVVQGGGAFAEDDWQVIRIGNIEFSLAKPCSRCVIPSIDPDSAEKQPEVVRALAKHRRRDGKVYFGQNLLHNRHGSIVLGDWVQVVR